MGLKLLRFFKSDCAFCIQPGSGVALLPPFKHISVHLLDMQNNVNPTDLQRPAQIRA
jgi:hypothetical protein